eukprot:2191221-Rhodomonas_salina.1
MDKEDAFRYFHSFYVCCKEMFGDKVPKNENKADEVKQKRAEIIQGGPTVAPRMVQSSRQQATVTRLETTQIVSTVTVARTPPTFNSAPTIYAQPSAASALAVTRTAIPWDDLKSIITTIEISRGGVTEKAAGPAFAGAAPSS